MADEDKQSLLPSQVQGAADATKAAMEEADGKVKYAVAIAGYAACSASLLVINKVAVHGVPAPSFILIMQFAASVSVVLTLSACGWLEGVEPLKTDRIKLFGGISLLFCACLYTNVKALSVANVDTIIVFRACSPIAVAFCDYYFLKSDLPSWRSWGALLTIVMGAVTYVLNDDGFEMESYFWVVAYFFTIVAEMVYTKYVLDSVAMSTWTRVYYNNALSIPPTLALGFVMNEWPLMAQHMWTVPQIGAVALSCVVGVGISYTGFHLRNLVSATSFTVIGVLNKLASVTINALIWSKHANGVGMTALVVCIGAGTFYEQSKKR